MSNDGKEQEATLEDVVAMATGDDCDSLESVEGTIDDENEHEESGDTPSSPSWYLSKSEIKFMPYPEIIVPNKQH